MFPLWAGLAASEGAARDEVNHGARDEVNQVSLSCAPPLRQIALYLLTSTHLRVAGSELSPQAEEQRGTMEVHEDKHLSMAFRGTDGTSTELQLWKVECRETNTTSQSLKWDF